MRIFTEEHRRNISESKKGEKNPMYGTHKSEKEKLAMSLARKNIPKSEETKQKIRIARARQIFTEEDKRKMGLSHLGSHRSEETKMKMSLALKGKPKSEEHKMKLRKPKSEEHKKKLSESMKGKNKGHIGYFLGQHHTPETIKNLSGENAVNWQGGKTIELYSKDFNESFKEAIKLRDNSCLICGTNDALCIHHIDYNKLNSVKENAVCLCRSCHSKTNFNREHWSKFFQSLLFEKYNYFYIMFERRLNSE